MLGYRVADVRVLRLVALPQELFEDGYHAYKEVMSSERNRKNCEIAATARLTLRTQVVVLLQQVYELLRHLILVVISTKIALLEVCHVRSAVLSRDEGGRAGKGLAR